MTNSALNTGVISFPMKMANSLIPPNSSSVVTIQRLPWQLILKKFGPHCIALDITCNEKSASTMWSCNATVELRIIRRIPLLTFKDPYFTKTYHFDNVCYGKNIRQFTDFATCEDILNPENGYILTDELIVEAHITVKDVVGIRKRKLIDYSAEDSSVFDVTLIVEGKAVHVNKSLLSLHSPFFNSLFYGNFAEKDKKEIQLNDVKYSEFIELLDVIFPTQTDITEYTVQSLLNLADRFNIDSVTDKCEKFLIHSPNLDRAKKLLYSQKFQLSGLMDSCLRSYKSLTDMYPLKDSDVYPQLSDDTKVALLERLIKLQEESSHLRF